MWYLPLSPDPSAASPLFPTRMDDCVPPAVRPSCSSLHWSCWFSMNQWGSPRVHSTQLAGSGSPRAHSTQLVGSGSPRVHSTQLAGSGSSRVHSKHLAERGSPRVHSTQLAGSRSPRVHSTQLAEECLLVYTVHSTQLAGRGYPRVQCTFHPAGWKRVSSCTVYIPPSWLEEGLLVYSAHSAQLAGSAAIHNAVTAVMTRCNGWRDAEFAGLSRRHT